MTDGRRERGGPPRVPERRGGSHRRFWAVALVVAVLLVGGWETGMRAAGVQAMPTDDFALWALNREAAVADCRTVALLGASRMQLNFNLRVAEAIRPNWDFVQLAVNGRYPMATLEALSRDAEFCGIALVSAVAEAFEEGGPWNLQRPWLDYYQGEWSWGDRVRRRMDTVLQQTFAVLNPRADLWTVLDQITSGRPIRPAYTRQLANRRIAADFGQTNPGALARHFVRQKRAAYRNDRTIPDPSHWLEQAMRVEGAVRRIQRRGGAVAFVRLPTARAHWALDERYYPRNLYWESFAKRTAATALHFKEIPGMDALPLPDTSHLDRSHTDAFTALLLAALERHGVFSRAAAAP